MSLIKKDYMVPISVAVPLLPLHFLGAPHELSPIRSTRPITAAINLKPVLYILMQRKKSSE